MIARQVEIPEARKAGQRRQVGHRVAGQVEALKSRQARRRRGTIRRHGALVVTPANGLAATA